MKNKESKRPSEVNYADVKKKLNQGNLQVAQPIEKPKKKGPTKSQIQRLKHLYNTTRWLPNSAFTTYFGKPAFENYGYGNTNPVYGGLFYGNYMLSHNMNPIDGDNHPPEKQVYSSAMMKSCQRKGIRRPSPPRMVPDEIRNTPEELQEIRTRQQIFQLPNNFPPREIIPPNLLKCRYFRSGKNTPENSEDEEESSYEVWNVENVLSGKKNKKKKIDARNKGGNEHYNPYKQGKVQLGKKKMKEAIDNKIDETLYQKVKEKKAARKAKEEVTKENEESDIDSEEEQEYEEKKRFYEEMLGEKSLKNIEDLKDVKIETKEDEERKEREAKEKAQKEEEEKKIHEEELKQQSMNNNTCPYCYQAALSQTGSSLLKKKENPALLPPGVAGNGFVCCMHHNLQEFDIQQQDPRRYKGMPPCMTATIVPAGLPMKKSQPLTLFG